MELFAAAGIDLPRGSGAGRHRGLPRTLRIPLFNYKVVQNARARTSFAPTPEQAKAAGDYARLARSTKFTAMKETAVRPLFIQHILQTVLGYHPVNAEGPFTLDHETAIRRGAVDVAIGHFDRPGEPDQVVAPFELKGPGFVDLDRIMPGRGRSPVQQAWDYAIDTPGSRWVLISNCVEIRLYGFGRGRDAYEVFDLTLLDDPERLIELWLILAEVNLLGGPTDRLLRDTDSAYRDITAELYRQYNAMRERLIAFLTGSTDGPKLSALDAIEPAQTILDRILFIAFAQRTDLLPDRLLDDAAVMQNKFAPQPIWANFLSLFRAIDGGNDRLGVWGYNGGLFAHDAVVDATILTDDLARDIAELGRWDYRREVPVTILGHIFEQSITDIERLKAESRGEAAPSVSKRKKEGIVYTPDIVTRFLVERTIGLSLDERLRALWVAQGLDAGGGTVDPQREIAVWNAALAMLRSLTILDPACGSGAFLVAAFDEMARRYRAVIGRLNDLGVTVDFDIFDEIVTKNLFGVDLNRESVEITRLSLWLKTARRDHRLQNLEATIKCGNSLIDDGSVTDQPFDWPAAFPAVIGTGGFDIVIGNPPYVRMEHLKAIKPYLQDNYAVAADRADLYAYFFEKGVSLLKPDGRLGYICSSTFFRTGSGENLRRFLADQAEVQDIVDFGDIQIFEGVTTYPAILTLRKGGSKGDGDVAFLNVIKPVPDDLGRAFVKDAALMPRARLGGGSWRFEADPLARLRDKIVDGHRTLGEVYGSPMRGIVTGLNDAFVIDTLTRDRLVGRDPRSADVLKPFLRGENIKRWRVESEGLYLINTPKGKIDIEQYPAVRDWLLPFRPALEKRATKQAWWELQQAQLVYQSIFTMPKIIYPVISQGAKFSIDTSSSFINDKCFMIKQDYSLVCLLNSKLNWYILFGLTSPLRGGQWRLELREQHVTQLPVPNSRYSESLRLEAMGKSCTEAARTRLAIASDVRHRILDLAPRGEKTLTTTLNRWYSLSFVEFRAAIKIAFQADIPVKQRTDWEIYLAEQSTAVNRLSATISSVEHQIDTLIYTLFDLRHDEVALLEASLVGQY